MKTLKRIITLLLAVLIVCALTVPAFAYWPLTGSTLSTGNIIIVVIIAVIAVLAVVWLVKKKKK